uniref:Uncharacterized protein n=1 Tax=Clytia hemisphaerica TaxID=252671 RepID=A0A7M5XCK0_9CNID|eukprot:TCONS_00062763-protein
MNMYEIFGILLVVKCHLSLGKERIKHKCTISYRGEPFCEYTEGDCQSRIVINSPHGGDLQPPDVPERDGGCFVDGKCKWEHFCSPKNVKKCPGIVEVTNDDHTQTITRYIVNFIKDLTGARPHFTRNNLHRSRIDANREIHESTYDFPSMVETYGEYHEIIQKACDKIQGPGIFIDMHGHTGQDFTNPFFVLGYNIEQVDFANETLTDSSECTIKNLIKRSESSMEEIIRGEKSLGYFLADKGYTRVMPSPAVKDPSKYMGYFKGGYNVQKYGSIDGGEIDAIQIEIHAYYNNEKKKVAKIIAESIIEWTNLHYGNLPKQDCSVDSEDDSSS